MRFNFAAFVALFIVLALSVRSAVRDQVTSSQVACRLLVKAAVQNHLAIENPGEEYFCGVTQKEGEYYIIDLHFTNRAAPKDWKGSTLVGYYGVHWKDGIIVEWDVIAEAPGKPVTSRKPNQPIQSMTDSFGASPLRV